MIGKIVRVPLRHVWKHEAHDFTRWIEENIDVLSDVIDLELAAAEREHAAGTFSVDVVAEDPQGNPVVIENHLEKSDHDHLGKLITYLTSIDASAGIWIVKDPRPEHIKAVAWLNETTSASFYMLKVEAIRIDDSPPAPLLTMIVGPSEESRQAGDTKKELAQRHILRKRFWTSLLERARRRTTLHANISPSHYHWVGTGAGRRGLSYNYVVTRHGATVELYIDRGKDSKGENEAIFDALIAHKEEIENRVGAPLDWERLEAKRACRIARRFSQGGYESPEGEWPSLQDAMIDAMVRLESALSGHIAQLKIGA